MSEELQNKLYNFYAQPSEGLWNKIDAALEEDSEKRLSQKLMNYQTAPPSLAWDNIAAALGKAQVIPLRKRFATPLKYSSAAAILIAVSMILNLLFNKESVSEPVGVPTIQQSTTPFPPSLVIEQPGNKPPSHTEISSDEPLFPVKNKRRLGKTLPLQTDIAISKLQERTSQVVDHHYQIVEPESLDRYVIFSKASGEAFRLSKKMFHFFTCSDYDENCKQNIESIQQRMADPSVMAAGDFPAVLALLQNMNNQ